MSLMAYEGDACHQVGKKTVCNYILGNTFLRQFYTSFHYNMAFDQKTNPWKGMDNNYKPEVGPNYIVSTGVNKQYVKDGYA